MKRHIFYIAVIAGAALSAAASSFAIHAQSKPAATTQTTTAPTVREAAPTDPAPVATNRPVVIDFYATWCGPCKAYKPVFDKVAKDYAKKASFMRVDVDKCPELAAKYHISSIPTTIILTPDGEVHKSVGYISEAQLRHDIDKALK